MARLSVACVLLTLLTAACSTPIAPSTPDDAIVYVVHRGWHTDVGLPADEITGPLATLKKSFPSVRFLTFGFGERQFLVTRTKNILAMLNALLPSQSALLMTALGAAPQQAFGPANVVVLHTPRAGLQRIEAAIWNEIERSANGEPMLLANGPYDGSVFYAARETYDGFYTCNSWTAETLHTGGLPMPVTGVLFAGQVMWMVRWIATQQDPQTRH